MASPEEPETRESLQPASWKLVLLERQERLDVEEPQKAGDFFTTDSENLWHMWLRNSASALFNMKINFVLSTWAR